MNNLHKKWKLLNKHKKHKCSNIGDLQTLIKTKTHGGGPWILAKGSLEKYEEKNMKISLQCLNDIFIL